MKLLSVAKVAKRLNCSTTSVYRMVSQGQITCFRTGPLKGFAVSEDEIEDFLAKRRLEVQQQELQP